MRVRLQWNNTLHPFMSPTSTARTPTPKVRGKVLQAELRVYPAECVGRASRPGPRSFFQVSHADAGSPGFGQPLTAFPGHKQGSGWEVEQLVHEPAPMWDLGASKATMPPHVGVRAVDVGDMSG